MLVLFLVILLFNWWKNVRSIKSRLLSVQKFFFQSHPFKWVRAIAELYTEWRCVSIQSALCRNKISVSARAECFIDVRHFNSNGDCSLKPVHWFTISSTDKNHCITTSFFFRYYTTDLLVCFFSLHSLYVTSFWIRLRVSKMLQVCWSKKTTLSWVQDKLENCSKGRDISKNNLPSAQSFGYLGRG